MKRIIIFVFFVFQLGFAFAQSEQSVTDLLSSEFHKKRRDVFRSKMPTNSVAVFFSNAIRNRSNDVDYVYHQDPNFYYLSGSKEPNGMLLIFKEKQRNGKISYDELLFVRSKDPLAELYDGARYGKDGAKEKLGFEIVFETPEFELFDIDFSSFDQVLFYDFLNDIRDTKEVGDLYDLIKWFKEKSGYIDKNNLKREPKKNNLNFTILEQILHDMRGIKEPEELDLIRKAVFISAVGQAEVMKAMEPGMSEREVQGLHEYIYKKYQSEYEGYPSIVGAGNNGCVLHYIENYKPKIEDGELILMDLGAEYHGYTADVTRTIPVNGKFSVEQKQIYDLVYEAQEAAMRICKEGTTFNELYEATSVVINKGLVELGVLKSKAPKDMVNPATGRHWYYPHGCCHHIGLDVHDMGNYNKLEANMVITIEPGIYIPVSSPADKKWWGIPVRIEDDYLITKDGCELLSAFAPRKSEDIEQLMKEQSPFNQVSLPELNK